MAHLVSAVHDWLDVRPVVHFFQDIFKSYDKYLHYKKTVEELSALTDKELNDIGISRGMIHSVAMEIYYDNR